MVIFNLLPWRELTATYQRSINRRVLLISLLVPLVIVTCMHFYLNNQITHLRQKIAVLKNTPTGVNSKSSGINQRMLKINKQLNRTTQQLFSTLYFSNALCLTEVRRVKNKIILDGYSDSKQALLDFVRRWEQKEFFVDAHIRKLEPKRNHLVAFTVQLQQIAHFEADDELL